MEYNNSTNDSTVFIRPLHCRPRPLDPLASGNRLFRKELHEGSHRWPLAGLPVPTPLQHIPNVIIDLLATISLWATTIYDLQKDLHIGYDMRERLGTGQDLPAIHY